MDREAWNATVQGVTKELETTEGLSHHHHCFGCRTIMMKDSECSIGMGGANT